MCRRVCCNCELGNGRNEFREERKSCGVRELIQKSITNGNEMRRGLVELWLIVSITKAIILMQADFTVLIVLESVGKGQDDSAPQLRRRIVRC